MFKVINERSGDARYSAIKEFNHISNFIMNLKEPDKYYPTNKVSKVITRSTSTSIILFELYELKDQVFWCKVDEFPVIKYSLENSKSYIRIVYIAGSVSPYIKHESLTRQSSLDGYEVKIDFD